MNLAKILKRFTSYNTGKAVLSRRERQEFFVWPDVIYAIGDVHGCLAELVELETKIFAENDAAVGDKWIVMLGDYIDRGPDSFGVIDRLIQVPPPGFKRISLCGNHEAMFLEFLRDPRLSSEWLQHGGIITLQSYGIDFDAFRRLSWSNRCEALVSHIPGEHLAFLHGLPISLSVPGTLFVHAGIRPDVDVSSQAEEDLLWIRRDFLDTIRSAGPRVVHGHTPQTEPTATQMRVGVDTGAYATGVLTAAKLTENYSCSFLSARAKR